MKNLIIIESKFGHRGEMTITGTPGKIKLVQFKLYDADNVLQHTLTSGSAYHGVGIFAKKLGLKKKDVAYPHCKSQTGRPLAYEPAFRVAFRCSGCLTPILDRGATGDDFTDNACPKQPPQIAAKDIFDCLYVPYAAPNSQWVKDAIHW